MMDAKKTILLVEDSQDDVFFMKRALKGAQISNPLNVAIHGQEAIEYLTGTGRFADRIKYPIPNLIFLDLKLPFKHGFEVLEWIKQQKHLENVPVIVLSSSSDERDIQKASQLGARSFFVKPPTPQMLVDLMVSLKGLLADT